MNDFGAFVPGPRARLAPLGSGPQAGSKAIVRDTVIAAVFALVAYFGFAQTLGINIGSGIVENAIERVLGIEGEGG